MHQSEKRRSVEIYPWLLVLVMMWMQAPGKQFHLRLILSHGSEQRHRMKKSCGSRWSGLSTNHQISDNQRYKKKKFYQFTDKITCILINVPQRQPLPEMVSLYIISLKMGDIDLLNVNVSHFKADHIFVRTWLHKIVLFCVLNPVRWPI